MTRYISRAEAGSTLVEFVLVTALFIVPLLLGTIAVGLDLIRSIQATQVNRDVGRMFSRGVDFSQPENINLIGYLANNTPGVPLPADGNKVVILSSIMYLDTANTCNCNNRGHAIFTSRVVLGNSSLQASRFGSPPSASMDAHGVIKDPYNDTTVRVDSFLAIMPTTPPMNDKEMAFLAETYYSPSLVWTIPGIVKSNGVFARGVF